MTRRAVLVMIAVLVTALGCRKPSASTATAGTGSAPATTITPAAAATDYRTLSIPQLEALIREKSGSPVTLTAAGTNRYTGTRPSPDGTAQLPVTVTVEAERITIETAGGGLSSKDVITPRGFEAGTLR
jgi:hypothetical protein